MERITVIGLDIAKSVFQVHGVDTDGEVVDRRRLPRSTVGRLCRDLARTAQFEQLPTASVVHPATDHLRQRR